MIYRKNGTVFSMKKNSQRNITHAIRKKEYSRWKLYVKPENAICDPLFENRC